MRLKISEINEGITPNTGIIADLVYITKDTATTLGPFWALLGLIFAVFILFCSMYVAGWVYLSLATVIYPAIAIKGSHTVYLAIGALTLLLKGKL